jgi:hypothetical protein
MSALGQFHGDLACCPSTASETCREPRLQAIAADAQQQGAALRSQFQFDQTGFSARDPEADPSERDRLRGLVAGPLNELALRRQRELAPAEAS